MSRLSRRMTSMCTTLGFLKGGQDTQFRNLGGNITGFESGKYIMARRLYTPLIFSSFITSYIVSYTVCSVFLWTGYWFNEALSRQKIWLPSIHLHAQNRATPRSHKQPGMKQGVEPHSLMSYPGIRSPALCCVLLLRIGNRVIVIK